jgi:hypothetical protein
MGVCNGKQSIWPSHTVFTTFPLASITVNVEASAGTPEAARSAMFNPSAAVTIQLKCFFYIFISMFFSFLF